jgi:hypothetical protein
MLSLAHRTGLLARRLPPMFAGWLIQYPDALFPRAVTRPPRPLPKPGTRDPRWPLEPDVRDRFQLITVGPADSALASEARALAADQPALLQHWHRADKEAGRESGFVLLRPDGFVAACGHPAELTGVAQALTALKATALKG